MCRRSSIVDGTGLKLTGAVLHRTLFGIKGLTPDVKVDDFAPEIVVGLEPAVAPGRE
jgi:hypothetical protein